MDNSNSHQEMQQAMDAGDFAKINEILQAEVQKPLTSDEKGAALVGNAMLFLDTMNAAQQNQLEAAEVALESLKALNEGQKKEEEKIKVAEVKDSLGI